MQVLTLPDTVRVAFCPNRDDPQRADSNFCPSFVSSLLLDCPQLCSAFANWMDELALAVDMTARNLQDKVRKAGLPWSAAKGFDTFTPVGYSSYHPSLSCFTSDVYSLVQIIHC